MKDTTYDVAIIGGGPAGSTVAALFALAGQHLIVFEREKFPRFYIGESLLPFSMKAFTRLELHEKFWRAGFMKKFGGEIIGACVGNSCAIRWRMWVFYFLVWLQRRYPISPRLKLVPRKEEAVASAVTASIAS